MPSDARQRDLLEALALARSPRQVTDLAADLAVSESTVRRELQVLERAGRVTRTYGGAMLRRPAGEPDRAAKELESHAEKVAIAREALGFLPDGGTVCLGAGSTAGELAHLVAARGGVHVVTNGVGTLQLLAHAPGVDVTVVGGHLRRVNQALVGSEAVLGLSRHRFDVCFMGVDGVVADRGISSPTADVAVLKEAKIASSDLVVLLADHSKLGRAPYGHWTPLARDWVLVTDEGATPDDLAPFHDDPRCRVVIARLHD